MFIRVAFIHDWLVTYAGAEKVLEQMLCVYPDADIFSTVDFLKGEDRNFLGGRKVTTSFIQRLPWAEKRYRGFLPLMPLAVEQFDLSSYDLVVSSSSSVAKGVITGPDQLHICMCHSPMRYAWDLQHQYLREAGLAKGLTSVFARLVLHYMRLWDYRTSHGVDFFISNSNFISRRVKKVYRRNSHTIYPPVDTETFSAEKVDSVEVEARPYITCSRMVPYKKIDLIVETFATRLKDKELVVIGGGPDFKKIEALAGPNVKLLGPRDTETLKFYLARSKAFLFAAEEDFGIAPIEAQSMGLPVIAYGKGGALETIKGLDSDLPTGVFFDAQEIEAVAEAVELFEQNNTRITPDNCRQNAARFGEARFREEFSNFVEDKYKLLRF